MPVALAMTNDLSDIVQKLDLWNDEIINGHVYLPSGLTIHLQANGTLLYAPGLKSAGWDGTPKRSAPGFLANGQWNVRWENPWPVPG